MMRVVKTVSLFSFFGNWWDALTWVGEVHGVTCHEGVMVLSEIYKGSYMKNENYVLC